MANIPQTRPDQSGGFMLIRYTDGTHTHRMRQHLQQFNISGTDLPYGVPGNQTEADVQATFTAFVNIVKQYFGNAWTFTLDAVYRNTGPDPNRAGYNLFTEIFGYNVPVGIVGTNGAQTNANAHAGMLIYNMRTLQGGRYRTVLIGTSVWSVNQVDIVTPTSGGSLVDQALMAYLLGAATGIVGHDGAKVAGSAHRTFPYNRRLRRRYGQA